ncbi:MAG: hypothetical protein P1S60_00525 [Anaerolineae bacterium]|nr:hypothetical protein [Anaerolineae bacterium]
MENRRITKRYFRHGVALFLLCIIITVLDIPAPPTRTLASPDLPAAAASATGQFIGDFFIVGKDATQPLYDQQDASVTHNPDRQEYFVVWFNARPVYPDIQGQRVRKDGRLVGNPFYIAGGNNRQRRYPDVVYNTTQQEYLVVWEEIPDVGYANIFAQRVGPTGGLIGAAIALGSGPELANCRKPAVAYASTADSYMVVWERMVQGNLSGDIEAQVVPGSGPFSPSNFLIGTGTITVDHSQPDIAYNRSRNEYLVVWTRHDKNANVKDIWGDIVTATGGPLVENLRIGYHTVDDHNASVVGTPTSPILGDIMSRGRWITVQ